MLRRAVLCLTLAACSRGGGDPSVTHVAHIENELLPTIAIRGQPPEHRSLVDEMTRLRIPAVSVAVVENGKIAWARAWGMADVESRRAATTTTLFQAASISKPVAATAMLTLVQDGRLELDTNVNTYLTSWQVPANAFTREAPVTLRRIVTHTAGFTVHGFPGYARSATPPTVVGVLDGKGNTDPVRVDTTPGVRFSYSGGGYTVMQLLLTDVTGQSFTDLMRQRVLAPTGMQRSTYAQPLPEARWPEAATGYRPSGEPVEEQWHVYPEQAAAGLWTTPTELLTWALAIRRAYAGATGEVLTPAMAKQMLTPDAHHWGLGPGFDDRDLSFGHGGANEGFRCQLVLLLDGSGGVAVMTNSDEGSPLVAEIAATVAADYGWPIRHPEERTVATLDSATLADLAGQYDVPGAGVVNVTADTNRLLLTLPDGRKVTLLPESADTLFDRDDGQRFTVVRQAGRVVAFEVSGTQAKKVK